MVGVEDVYFHFCTFLGVSHHVVLDCTDRLNLRSRWKRLSFSLPLRFMNVHVPNVDLGLDLLERSHSWVLHFLVCFFDTVHECWDCFCIFFLRYMLSLCASLLVSVDLRDLKDPVLRSLVQLIKSSHNSIVHKELLCWLWLHRFHDPLNIRLVIEWLKNV